MIPKYPFAVEVTYHLGGDRMERRIKNYETLDGAHSYSSFMLRKGPVKRVRVMVVIDDTSSNSMKLEGG